MNVKNIAIDDPLMHLEEKIQTIVGNLDIKVEVTIKMILTMSGERKVMYDILMHHIQDEDHRVLIQKFIGVKMVGSTINSMLAELEHYVSTRSLTI